MAMAIPATAMQSPKTPNMVDELVESELMMRGTVMGDGVGGIDV